MFKHNYTELSRFSVFIFLRVCYWHLKNKKLNKRLDLKDPKETFGTMALA